MKGIKRIALILIIIIITFSITFSEAISLSPLEVDIANKDCNKYFYNYMIMGLGQNDIKYNARNTGAIAEYRILYILSFVGDYYYDLQVYRDGTGKFTFIVPREINPFSNEKSDTVELLINEQRRINKEDAAMLLKSINDNDFWDIETVNEDMIDGRAAFIEGFSEGKEHFVRGPEPEEGTGIYNILTTFEDYSKKIAENPLKEIEQKLYGSN